MEKYRPQGFLPDELKVYWNYEQIAQLCQTTNPPHDPSDKDVIGNLQKHPVERHFHSGRITYKTTGIEKVVFEVPESAQIILLNFAVDLSFLSDIHTDYSVERTITGWRLFETRKSVISHTSSQI